MKAKALFITTLLAILTLIMVTPVQVKSQGVSVGFQVFYDELSPYGTWVYNPEYGYVWMPDVEPGFVPYSTNGYWIYTNEGWTWISNYSWGWAPFHYGRWYTDANYGPMWVPDNEWGPGWVTWRRSAGFYGWAPIGPGVSITIAYGSNYYVPHSEWTFVRDVDFGRTNINRYYIDNSYNVTIINSSTIIYNSRTDRLRNVTYNTGPGRMEAEKRAGRNFEPVTIREFSKPGQNLNKDQLQIYRPAVRRNNSSGVRAAPAKVERMDNMRTSEQRRSSPSYKGNQQPRQQPAEKQQQRQAQPSKQQPSQQQQRQAQPSKQQPSHQQQRQAQPTKQQPSQQQQRQAQPSKQQPSQPQQRQAQPSKQQQPRQSKPIKNTDKEKGSQKDNPPKSFTV